MNYGDELAYPLEHSGDRSGWQKFTYVSGSPQSDPHSVNLSVSMSHNASDSSGLTLFPLSATKVGDRVQIAVLHCGDANNRLMGMGLMPGAIAEVVSSTGTGSIILALGNQRLGLGADLTPKIQVAAIDPGSDPIHSTPTSGVETSGASAHSDSPSPERNSSMQTPISAAVTLRNAAIGSTLRVVGYSPTARAYKRKLLAMGLTPGTEFIVTRHAPLGDPTQVEVRGFNLSLRKDEADALQVELIQSPPGGHVS